MKGDNMRYLGTIAALIFSSLVAAPMAANAEPVATKRISIDTKLYRNHQVCLADVRDRAGEPIVAFHIGCAREAERV